MPAAAGSALLVALRKSTVLLDAATACLNALPRCAACLADISAVAHHAMTLITTPGLGLGLGLGLGPNPPCDDANHDTCK